MLLKACDCWYFPCIHNSGPLGREDQDESISRRVMNFVLTVVDRWRIWICLRSPWNSKELARVPDRKVVDAGALPSSKNSIVVSPDA